MLPFINPRMYYQKCSVTCTLTFTKAFEYLAGQLGNSADERKQTEIIVIYHLVDNA
jgi:hypothetical protein